MVRIHFCRKVKVDKERPIVICGIGLIGMDDAMFTKTKTKIKIAKQTNEAKETNEAK